MLDERLKSRVDSAASSMRRSSGGKAASAQGSSDQEGEWVPLERTTAEPPLETVASVNGDVAPPSAAATSSAAPAMRGVRAYSVLLAVTVSLICAAVDINIVATAVPEITDHFHTVSDVGWYAAAYRLGTGATQLAFGKLYKTMPLKPMLATSVSFSLLGSILCAAAVSSPMFIVGRAMVGVGTAGIGSGLFSVIATTVPLHRRPLYTSVYGAIETLAGLVGPVLGGLITQNLSWRWCFWINVPPSGTALAAIILLLPRSSKYSVTGERAGWREATAQFDFLGNVVFVAAWTALITALNWGGITYSWSSPQVIVLLAASGVLLLLFALIQHRKGDAALLPHTVYKHRNVQMAVLYALTSAAALGLLEYYAPTYFQAVRGYSPARSGYMTVPCLIAFTVAMLIQGFGTSRSGQYAPFMILSSALLPVGIGLMTTWGLSTGVTRLIIYFAFAGFAAGLGCVCTFAAVQAVLSKTDTSQGIALVLLANAASGAIFVSVAQAVFVAELSTGLRRLLPGQDPRGIEGLGLSEIKRKFTGVTRERVEIAFNQGIVSTWYLALALACASMIAALRTEWRSVKQASHS